MKRNLLLALAFVAGSAQAAVLDFNGNICDTVSGACGDAQTITQSYGDSANIEVIWDADISATGNQDFYWWSTGYSGQTNIAYTPFGAVGEIFLKPSAGFQVTLNSLDIGAWLSVPRTTQVSVFDGLTNQQLFSSGNITFNTLQLLTFSNLTSANGLIINLGPDSFYTGIDNINFTVSAVDVNAVPLPAAAWLFGSALMGFMGFSTRRKV